jgi:hypothetical protein
MLVLFVSRYRHVISTVSTVSRQVAAVLRSCGLLTNRLPAVCSILATTSVISSAGTIVPANVSRALRIASMISPDLHVEERHYVRKHRVLFAGRVESSELIRQALFSESFWKPANVCLWFAKNASGAKTHVSTSIASGSREPGRLCSAKTQRHEESAVYCRTLNG